MSKQPGLSPQQRQRIVQGLEVSVFVAGALLFQTYHPLWMWPLGIRTLVTVGVFLALFCCTWQSAGRVSAAALFQRTGCRSI